MMILAAMFILTIVEESNYDAFGLKHQGYNNVISSLGSSRGQALKYNGKELQEDYGLNWYDYGARFYEPAIARWQVPDPMAEKYASWTPYNYCLNNPVNIVDFDGRDIIVLNAPKAVKAFGHAAVLIGNDKTGWYLYSKNGTRPIVASGPSNHNVEAGIPFRDLNDFKERYLYSDKNIDQETGEVIYTKAYKISTSTEEDEKMEAAAFKETIQWYDFTGKLGGNCIDVPKEALKAVGLNPGTIKIPADAFGINFLMQAFFNSSPNKVYQNIVAGNEGVDISDELKLKIDNNLLLKNTANDK